MRRSIPKDSKLVPPLLNGDVKVKLIKDLNIDAVVSSRSNTDRHPEAMETVGMFQQRSCVGPFSIEIKMSN